MHTRIAFVERGTSTELYSKYVTHENMVCSLIGILCGSIVLPSSPIAYDVVSIIAVPERDDIIIIVTNNEDNTTDTSDGDTNNT